MVAGRLGQKQTKGDDFIDGGTKESGGALVKHIQKYYKTDCVDYVVNTHPDKDHASGLTEILENLKVKELWIHRPWCYIDQIIKFIDNPSNNFKRDKRTTTDSMRERFEQKYYQYARKLETIATQKEIEIKEPYEGCQIGVFQVLSPNKDWHLYDLIPNSNKTKEISIEDSKQTSILDSCHICKCRQEFRSCEHYEKGEISLLESSLHFTY